MTRDDIYAASIAVVFITIGAVGLTYEGHQKDRLLEQVRIASDDLGCTYIEQSNKNPNNFYIDCGDDQIRIIKIEKE